MSPATALVLLGLGLGALVVADRASPRVARPLRERAVVLQQQATRAQEASALSSRRARELVDQWSAAEDAAQKAGQ